MKLRIVRPREIGMLSEHAGKVYEVAKVGEKEYRLVGIEHYRIRVEWIGENKPAEIVQEFSYGLPVHAGRPTEQRGRNPSFPKGVTLLPSQMS